MPPAIEIIIRAIGAIALVVALTRRFGLRSFSKMSSFDFAVTVAIGSVLASTTMSISDPFWHGALTLIVLFTLQGVIAQGRSRFKPVVEVTDNDPLLLMRDGEILHDNLKGAGLTEGDLMGKLREANALQFADVRAVVFEPTGDVSVLHGDAMDDRLLKGIRTS